MWLCTPCVGPGPCVHGGVGLPVCCCVGVNCGGCVFMPGGLGSVYLQCCTFGVYNHGAQADLQVCTERQGLASGSGLWLLRAQGLGHLQQVMVAPGNFRDLRADASRSSVPDCWVT